MKFGLSFLPDCDGSIKKPDQYYQEAFLLSKMADQAGFEYIKMTEHYLHPYGGYCPNPLNFLSAVATQTQKIRLMTGCLLPVFHHPIQLASETAMVDAISQGRLDVGFARAYLPYEFNAFGISMDESRERFTTTIDAVRSLWVHDNVTIATPYFTFNNATTIPKPIQKPHPPIWCAAVNSRQSFSWIGEQGFNLLITPPPGPIENLIENISIYRESLPISHQGDIAISLPLLVDESESVALEHGTTYLRNYLDVWSNATDHWQGKSSSDYPGYTHMAKFIRASNPSDMIDNKQALIGTPSKVIDDIFLIKEKLGITTFLFQIDFGSQPLKISQKSIELISQCRM